MATKLDKTIKRELEIEGQAYMIAISPEGLKITQKGHRKGNEVSWKSLLGGSHETADSSSAGGSSDF
jgi:hypothetical protein